MLCCAAPIAYPHPIAMQRTDGPQGNDTKVNNVEDARDTQMAPPLLFLYSPCYILYSLEAGTITLQVYIQTCFSFTRTRIIGTLIFKYLQPLFSGFTVSEICRSL